MRLPRPVSRFPPSRRHILRSPPCMGEVARVLLAILFLAPGLLRGQSGRDNPVLDVAIPLPPHMVQPPSIDSLRPGLPITPPGTFEFPILARAAGTIFSGTVTAVARHAANSSQSVETVAITFHIENAIRGATPGEDLTISQWIGLWSGGQRDRVGERVLLFPLSPEQARTHEYRRRRDGAFYHRFVGPCLAFSTTSFSLSSRYRPVREVACKFQRLCLGGTAGQ